MSRRAFIKDLAETSLPVIPNVEGVHSPDEGVVSCRYTYCKDNKPINVEIQLYATKLDEYPIGNSFMLYTEDDNLDEVIPRVLQSLTAQARGKSLPKVLSDMSLALTEALSQGIHLSESVNHDEQSDSTDDPDLDVDDDSDWDFGFDEKDKSSTAPPRLAQAKLSTSYDPTDQERFRADLRVTKEAGFRIGVLGNLMESGILCVSIRVDKLGVSDEAMQAWNLERGQYLVLLIKYHYGYRTLAQIINSSKLSDGVELRVGLCKTYKPSITAAESTFHSTMPKDQRRSDDESNRAEAQSSVESLFIGKPLNQLLRDFLHQILQARVHYGLSWLGSEKFVQKQRISTSAADLDDMSEFECDDIDCATSLAPVAAADHISASSQDDISFPLAAMQFVLRHVVRCTEFCLVCHFRLEKSFEALKPYVCSQPLCLYQYMSLGFGPEIEYEIKNHPYVVDLLINFCHLAAASGSLKVLPVGMDFYVPVLPEFATELKPAQQRGQSTPTSASSKSVQPMPEIKKSFTCKFKKNVNELMIAESSYPEATSLRPGAWLAIVADSGARLYHCRVERVMLPSVRLSQPIESVEDDFHPTDMTSATKSDDSWRMETSVDCYIYEHKFDDLPPGFQHHAIRMLLDTLPSVQEMCTYLEDQACNPEASLKSWGNRISGSAFNVLRWIIASNRSCIMQVDEIVEDGDSLRVIPGRDRVGGMDGWVQFRFAQGAPDKESKFIGCLDKETKGSGYPSLWAWHGSRLSNWHSIVRRGLRYEEVVNGRAFGDGVYMSNQATTSLSYSMSSAATTGWKASMLRITHAFSLNEVVNKAEKFVSSTPHYVVAKIDWIQTRYLFVKTTARVITESSGYETEEYKQDPTRRVYNEKSTAIKIPVTAVSKSRRPGIMHQSNDVGRQKRSRITISTDLMTAERTMDDGDSIVSDDDDLAVLSPRSLEANQTSTDSFLTPDNTMTLSNRRKNIEEACVDTDFVPGQLKLEGIKFLQPPKDATSSSTKALMRTFREVLEVQETTRLSTLGWYIDSNIVTNMYQWIVELHSFPSHLALAQDLKAAGLTSIVLEVRFQASFPFTPPFIRVVKPRFLPFSQGGGGNVTEGGAMCMEILTNNGWTAAQSIDGLLLQVRMAITDEERPARLAKGAGRGGLLEHSTYGVGEAVEAYKRACRTHGWTVPSGFDSLGKE